MSLFRLHTIAAALLLFPLAASGQLTASPGNAIIAPGKTQTFTINVPSGTTLASFSVLTFGAPNRDFTSVAAGTSCPNVVSGVCTIEVQFQPTVPGRRQGAIVVFDPPGNTLLSVSLDGAGNGALLGFAPSPISTFAGGGSASDGAQASSAELALPMGITIDGFGNYYIVDQSAQKVRKVTPSGVISTFAGTGTAGFSGDGGPAASAQLNDPTDVVVDGGGAVYISDTGNNVVRMVGTNGIISTYAGQYYPTGAAAPAVCASATNSVGDGCPGNKMILNTPTGLVFCHAQNLHISDKLHNMVRTIDRITYNTFTQVGNGVEGYNGDGELNTSAELNGPMGLDMDAANYIYVADSGNHIVRKTLLTGTTPNPISTIAGVPGSSGNSGDGTSAINAQLNRPFGVKVDPAGDVYISDFASSTVRKVNVATGVITAVAGTGNAGFSGNGGPAASAQLNAPAGIALDDGANLYIADSGNARLRKIDVSDAPSLSFTTSAGTTSAPQDVAVMNLGNTPLNISQISASAGFSFGGSDTSCSSSGNEGLDAAQDCTLGIEFMPSTAGNFSGTVALTDNVSPPSQTIKLTGATTALAMTYTLAVMTPAITLNAGSNGAVTLSVDSNNYAGTVSFAASVSTIDGTPSDLTASASSVTLAPGASQNSTLTIAANSYADHQKPSSPWAPQRTAIFCMALVGFPLTLRRKRRAEWMLLVFAIALSGSLMACSGRNYSPTPTSSHTARTYVVTVTPTASAMSSATVMNPSPVSITVTVQ